MMAHWCYFPAGRTPRPVSRGRSSSSSMWRRSVSTTDSGIALNLIAGTGCETALLPSPLLWLQSLARTTRWPWTLSKVSNTALPRDVEIEMGHSGLQNTFVTRKGDGEGKGVAVRVRQGGRRCNKKKKQVE